jgi:DNA repair protein RadC
VQCDDDATGRAFPQKDKACKMISCGMVTGMNRISMSTEDKHDYRPLPLRQVPYNERPRERLSTYGPTALSSAELLAIILGTGSRQENVVHLAERLLAHFGGLNALAQTSHYELEQIHGLGTAKITRLLAALELGRRLVISTPEVRPIVHTSADAARLVMDMGDLPQEHIRLILLDTSHRVIATPTIYIGTVNTAVLRTSEIFREAIVRNAPAIIVVHNHPSGDPSPSPEDVQLTRRLIDAGDLLDIVLLDHIIIGHNTWRSLKEMKLGF